MADLLSVRVTGVDAVVNRLARIGASATHLESFWTTVFAPKYFASVQDVFATEGRRRGAGGRFVQGFVWARLSPPYKARKDVHYPGRKILDRTGALKASLLWTGSGLGPGGIFLPSGSSVEFGTSVLYAKYHQFGTSKMPARPFLDLPDPSTYGPLLASWLVSHGEVA